MPRYYTADYIYNEFSGLAGMRKGNPAYDNDSTYWDGGRCNWGGSHNLREDCGTLARGFEKLESLDSKKITEELINTTSQGEFETKKQNYIRKINEITNGLQARTGYSSSMFGICIIWADEAMSPHVESMMQECRRDLDTLRSQLGQEKYQWVEELKRIQFEIDKIEAKMKENQRKALRETDPIKKQALIAEIEADGKLLEQKYAEKQKLENKFNFDPAQKVQGMVDAMKRAIERSGRGGSSGGSDWPKKPRKPNDDKDLFGDKGDGENRGDGDTLPDNNSRIPRRRNQLEQSNQQMILIVVVAVVVLFLIMNQKDSQPRSRYEDYY